MTLLLATLAGWLLALLLVVTLCLAAQFGDRHGGALNASTPGSSPSARPPRRR